MQNEASAFHRNVMGGGLFVLWKRRPKTKKVSSTEKMKGSDQNQALFRRILHCSALYGHRMGEYSVHLPAHSGQVRVYIALQGDVGIGVTQ